MWVWRVPFVPAPGRHPAYYPNHTKSNKQRMSFSKHGLDPTASWINIFTDWLGFNGRTVDPWTISVSLTVLTEPSFLHIPVVYLPPELLVHGGEAQHTVRVSCEWRWDCVLGGGRVAEKLRKHQRRFRNNWDFGCCWCCCSFSLQGPTGNTKRPNGCSHVGHLQFVQTG